MAQIQNFGFEPSVQESDVQHAPRPRGGAGQSGRQPKSAQYALCHPHYTRAHGQGFGRDVPVGYDHQQFADGAVPTVQIPATERIGETEYQLVRCVGCHLCQEIHRFRVFGNEQHRAERTLPLLHQSAGAGGVLLRDYRLSYGRGCRRGSSRQERDTPQYPAHAPAGGVYRKTDAICTIGRRDDTRTRTALRNGRQGQDADRNGLCPQDGTRYAADRPQLRRPRGQQSEPLRPHDCRILPQVRRAERNAVRLLGFGDVPAGTVECVQRDQT